MHYIISLGIAVCGVVLAGNDWTALAAVVLGGASFGIWHL